MLTSVLRRSSTLYRAMSTLSRPHNWKAAAPDPAHGITFAAQSNLPKFPLPDLDTTLARLKESLKPIAWSDQEYSVVGKKIDDFASGKGLELQKILLKRYNETPHWLEQWWDDGAYLGYRDTPVINASYYYGFDAQPAHLPQTPAARAAGLARATMTFRKQFKQGTLKPEATKEGALCMDTYRWMFDCSRVPGQDIDWGVSYAKAGDSGDSGHIVVIRNNRFWKVEAADNGQILSTAEFERQFQHIYENSNGDYPGVGVLSASHRDIWAADYGNLASSLRNSEIIRDIHSSAFIICLDSSKPTTPEQHSRYLWHGDVVDGIPIGLQNRWVDKPLQFIVFDNVKAGILGEHSIMDGTPVARLCDEVLEMLHDRSFDHGSGSTALVPTPLDWEVSPSISEAISKADTAARELIEDHELNFHLTRYGKAAIKAFRVSPDSWAQMIIQLAHKRLIGDAKRIGGTYEAASTRGFYKGRTETIRVVTSEADAWVRSMDDPSATIETRKKLFDAAAGRHVALAKEGGRAQGIDRHLFGLKSSLKDGEEVPALFTDPVYTRGNYWTLSTSAVFSKHFPVYGWGEVVPKGFGVAYMTGYDDRLQYTITSRKEMPNAKFCEEIVKAADDLYDLHASLSKSKL
ncbi:hypothetical protein AX15_006462 [Amanita polypyramis BW_CC]|nr:hypothetical protein AX15_006462 [Amanita polypyramis BW_CC]